MASRIQSPSREPRIGGRRNRVVRTKAPSKSKRKSVPNWSPEIAAKLEDDRKYRKITINKDGSYVSGNLSGTGIIAMFKKMKNGQFVNRDLVYLPSVRLAGKSNVINKALDVLVAEGAISSDDANAAWNDQINFDNYTDPEVENMVAEAKEFAAEASKKELDVPLSLLTLLYKQSNDHKVKVEVQPVEQEEKPKQGRKGKAKKDVDVLQTVLKLAESNDNVAKGDPYKYVRVDNWFNPKSKTKYTVGTAPVNSLKVLKGPATMFPIRADDKKTLLLVLNELWSKFEDTDENHRDYQAIVDSIEEQDRERKLKAPKTTRKTNKSPARKTNKSPARKVVRRRRQV
jgi:hypothetical protein